MLWEASCGFCWFPGLSCTCSGLGSHYRGLDVGLCLRAGNLLCPFWACCLSPNLHCEQEWLNHSSGCGLHPEVEVEV